MFSRARCSRFSQKESSYKCENCACATNKKSNFLRHLTSLRHGYLRLNKGENTVDKELSVCTGKDADVVDIDSDIGLQDDAYFDIQDVFVTILTTMTHQGKNRTTTIFLASLLTQMQAELILIRRRNGFHSFLNFIFSCEYCVVLKPIE